MKISSVLATAMLAFMSSAQEEENKVEAGCLPCQSRCPAPIAMAAAGTLVQDFFQYINDKNLAAINDIISRKQSVMRIIMEDADAGRCVNSGDTDLLSTLIPMLPTYNIPSAALIEQSYVDGKGRVIVFAAGPQEIGSSDPNLFDIKSRFVFEAVEGSCKFLLSEYQIMDLACDPYQNAG